MMNTLLRKLIWRQGVANLQRGRSKSWKVRVTHLLLCYTFVAVGVSVVQLIYVQRGT